MKSSKNFQPNGIPISKQNRTRDTTAWILSDIARFSEYVLNIPLHQYQITNLYPIIDSIIYNKGYEFLLVYPRQSGKNESIAQLIAYLMLIYMRKEGQIVFAAEGDGLERGLSRLDERLDNGWTKGRVQKQSKPKGRKLGKVKTVFLSTNVLANTRGETAHHLLVIDEAQDQVGSHIEAVFTPMRAAYNATAVYLGTVKQTTDYLWTKKTELEAATKADGIQRVFFVTPEQVMAENKLYRKFLNSQIRRYGREHPIISSEYFLEPIDGAGGLFNDRRRALMLGTHDRYYKPLNGKIYVATIDIAGQDEGATDPVAQIDNPGRDYTVVTVFEVVPNKGDEAGPTYKAVDVFVDQGGKHFEDVPGQPQLSQRILAYLRHWGIQHTIIDSSGVGEGLYSWLSAKLGNNSVTPFTFSGPTAKALLGSQFLAVVETGRFKYWSNDYDMEDTDGWWFFQQAKHCSYELAPQGVFHKHLKWGVPASKRIDLPGKGMTPVHDDRLLSAALIAEIDQLQREGKLRLGNAFSTVIVPTDLMEEIDSMNEF